MAEAEQPNVTMTPHKRFILGGIGALLPIIVSLTTLVDIDTAAVPWGKIIGALIRDTALFVLGGFIAYVHEDEVKPFKIVEIGVAAPAFILTLTTSNGMNNEQNKVALLEQNIQVLKSELEELKKPEMKRPKFPLEPVNETPKPAPVSFDFSIINSAYAEGKAQKPQLAQIRFVDILKGMAGDVSPEIKQAPPVVNPNGIDVSTIKAAVQPIDVTKEKYLFSIYLNAAQEELDKISQVDYAFLHSAFANQHVVKTDAKTKFLYSYPGWGCLTSIAVTITYKNGAAKTLDFNMCKDLGPDWE